MAVSVNNWRMIRPRPRANRQPHRNLPATRKRPRQQNAGNVGAGDDQDERHDCHEQRKESCNGKERFVGNDGRCGHAQRFSLVRFGYSCSSPLMTASSCADACFLETPGFSRPPIISQPISRLASMMGFCIDATIPICIHTSAPTMFVPLKSFGRNSGDRECAAVDLHRPAGNVWIAVKMPLPESVAQDDSGRR
jgi:hypothetical protein